MFVAVAQQQHTFKYHMNQPKEYETEKYPSLPFAHSSDAVCA